MKLYFEWGIRQVNKRGEELCGDNIAVSRQKDSVMLALSDGLGSGVKANILATLTTQIAMHLLQNNLPLGEIVETLTKTLPVDRVRKLAYSTFAIAQFFRQGTARIVEFDSPAAIFLRNRRLYPVIYNEKLVAGKKIQEAVLDLKEGDWVAFVSDGVLNAGIGGVYPLGWGWEKTAGFLEKHAHNSLTADDLAGKVAESVCELYAGAPGDDVSIVVIKVRKKLVANIFTGPPAYKSMDEKTVDRFLRYAGLHVVCGGTTAKIVSHYMGMPLEVDLDTMTQDVPPVAHIQGIDLVSEGILTLTRTSMALRSQVNKKQIQFQTDGVSDLLRIMLTVDHVHFLVGQAVNPAHQNPELPHQLGIRMKVVEEIAEELRKYGKEVTMEEV